MPIYIVSCALRDLRHDYSPFWSALEKAGAERAMEAVWLLETNQEIMAVTNAILPHLTSEDRLLVAEIGKWSATRLLNDAGAWLKRKQP